MFKPMLSPGDDPLKNPNYFKDLRYPLLCSPKLDGIRCVIKNNIAYSRTYKPIPSLQVQEEFTLVNHLDGELIEGNPTDADVYNRTQSHIMSEDKPGNVTFRVFDFTHPDWLHKPFHERLDQACIEVSTLPSYKIVDHVLVEDYDSLIEFENSCLFAGYEGIMMRDPFGRYKNGRGTFKEGLIYKLKRFQDDEAIIVDFVAQLHNTNTLEKDELGYAKRSSSKDGMVELDTLGKFIVAYGNDILEIAPGQFTHSQRKHIWDNKEAYLGELLKFRFFNHGIKDKPRFPRAVGFRNRIDI